MMQMQTTVVFYVVLLLSKCRVFKSRFNVSIYQNMIRGRKRELPDTVMLSIALFSERRIQRGFLTSISSLEILSQNLANDKVR